MRRSPLPALLLVLPVLALGLGAGPPAEDAAEDAYVGSDVCVDCHDDVGPAFGMTVHATAPGWSETHGCEACHGPGAEHAVSEGEEGTITDLSALSPAEASATCLSCHERKERLWHFRRTLHSPNEVGCTTCHNPHLTTASLLRQPGTALCSSCHQGIAAEFGLPRSHPISDEVGCIRCHDPHGTNNRRMAVSFGTDTCTECHFDKHGPFIFQHDVSVVEGCQMCHAVHGSTNRHLLKRERQVNLCYECHPGTTTPEFHSFQNFLGEKCTACHTAIHGSNTSPYFLEE